MLKLIEVLSSSDGFIFTFIRRLFLINASKDKLNRVFISTMISITKRKILSICLVGLFVLVPFFVSFIKICKSEEINTLSTVSSENLLSMFRKENLKNPTEYLEEDRNSVQYSKVDPSLYQYYKSEIVSDTPIKVFLQTEKGLTVEQKRSILNAQYSMVQILKDHDNLPLVLVLVNPSNLGVISQNEAVKAIYPNKVMKLHQTTDRELLIDAVTNAFVNLDGSKTTNSSWDNWWLEAIGANQTELTGKGVKVAILDTGVSIHPDLLGNGTYSSNGVYSIQGESSRLQNNLNFAKEDDEEGRLFAYDTYGHGTHCAGIVAGNGKLSNGTLRGVAPAAIIYNLRVINSSGEAEDEWILDGLNYLVNTDVDIVSMSFGGMEPFGVTAEEIACETLVNAGKILFSSAGNSGPNYYSQGAPASYPYVIAVGATDKKSVTSFSSVGPTWNDRTFPDIVAPGEDILSLNSIRGEMFLGAELIDKLYHKQDYFGYVKASGTSMSCPMAAGMAALIKEKYPTINPFAMRVALIKGAKPIDGFYLRGIDKSQGAGLINLPSTLSYIEANKVGSDPNKIAAIFYNNLPYEPKNLIQKPGDTQYFNYTFISGYAGEFSIEKVGLNGLSVSLDKNLINLSAPGLGFLGGNVKIPANVSAGQYQGEIQIKEGSTIIDSINVSITISNPKASIYFDTFHNSYDSGSVYGYRMTHFHQTLTMLYEQNYSVKFNSYFYNNDEEMDNEGELIHEGKLNADILVIMNPIYPFLPYEINKIKEFYNNGGSILVSAGVHTVAALDSLNTLLSQLDSGIQFINQSAQYTVDYIDPFDYPFIVRNITNSHPIFSGISEYITGAGALIQVNNESQSIATISNKTVVAFKDGSSENKGKILAFNDQLAFTNIFRWYSSNGVNVNDKLAENVFNYLTPNSSLSFQVMEARINFTEIPTNFSVSILNRTINQPIANLDPTELNVSLWNNNIYLESYNLSHIGNGFYQLATNITANMSSPYPYQLKFNISIDSVLYTYNYSFYYYNSSVILNYVNGSMIDGPLARVNNTAVIQFNSTLSGPSGVTFAIFGSYAAVDPFSRKMSQPYQSNPLWNSTGNFYYFQPQPLNSTPSGYLFFQGYMEYENYTLLNPARWRARIYNEDPYFLDSSIIDGLKIEKYISQNIAIFSKTDNRSEFTIKITDTEDSVLQRVQSVATVSLVPITLYKGSFVLIEDPDPIYYELEYNTTASEYQGIVYFNNTLSIDDFGQEKLIPVFDNPKIYYLVYLSIRDLDGGNSALLYLVLLGTYIEIMMNYGPFIYTSLAIVAIVVVSKILHENKKKRALILSPN